MKKNKSNGNKIFIPCSFNNIIQVDDRVNHFSWTEYHEKLPDTEPLKKHLKTH